MNVLDLYPLTGRVVHLVLKALEIAGWNAGDGLVVEHSSVNHEQRMLGLVKEDSHVDRAIFRGASSVPDFTVVTRAARLWSVGAQWVRQSVATSAECQRDSYSSGKGDTGSQRSHRRSLVAN